MKITHLGLSAVLVEMAGQRLLIDPGNFSDEWHGLTELDAVLVTHQHPDHVDPKHVPGLLEANPDARVIVEPSVPQALDLPRAERLAAGESIDLGGVTVSGAGGRHAVIHPDIPRIGNVGLVVEAEGEPRLFHPGDAYDTVVEGIDVLCLPAHGPWSKMSELIDFARGVKAPQGFLVHDGLLGERGWQLSYQRLGEMAAIDLHDLRDGQVWDVA